MNLIYIAKPRFGGWVTFTAHLARKYNYKLYKIHTKTEVKKDGSPVLRDYGYGVKYQNISMKDAAKLKNIMITAIDKNYYKYLDDFNPEDNSNILSIKEHYGDKLIVHNLCFGYDREIFKNIYFYKVDEDSKKFRKNFRFLNIEKLKRLIIYN